VISIGFNAALRCLVLCHSKYQNELLTITQIGSRQCATSSPPEGRFAIVTERRARDAMDAEASGDLSPDENATADGEVVWSWRRDPGATCGSFLPHNGGKKGRFPGESTYKL
jgi:hypothetical protein